MEKTPDFTRTWRTVFRDDQGRRCTSYFACDSITLVNQLRQNPDLTITEINPLTGEKLNETDDSRN